MVKLGIDMNSVDTVGDLSSALDMGLRHLGLQIHSTAEDSP